MFRLHVFGFLLLFMGQYGIFALQDVTVDLFGPENYGTLAAFGDFNADKQTDIFIIRERMIILKTRLVFSDKSLPLACSVTF